jgi:hypothetical protein
VSREIKIVIQTENRTDSSEVKTVEVFRKKISENIVDVGETFKLGRSYDAMEKGIAGAREGR